jgi:UDP-glucuronate 4-epimerase
MDTIIITGVAGFIGYNLAERLIHSYNIIGVDNMAYDNPMSYSLKLSRLDNLKKHSNFRFMKYDLSDKYILDVFPGEYYKNKIKCIIHLAAKAGVTDSLIHSDEYVNSNIIGFTNILKLAVHLGIDHVIYASSSSVYGDKFELTPSSETSNTDHPKSFYAVTKKCSELIADLFNKDYGLNCTGLRFFSVYGPWGRPDMSYFKFVNNLVNSEQVTLYGYGESVRNFTYIDDVTKSIELLIDKPKHKIYNVSGLNSSIKIKDLFELIRIKALEYNMIKSDILTPLNCELRSGDVNETNGSSEELFKDINYLPSTKLGDGITEFLYWYRNYYCL